MSFECGLESIYEIHTCQQRYEYNIRVSTFVAIGEAGTDVDSGVGAADLDDVHAGVDERLVRELQEEPELRVGLLRLDPGHLEEEVVEEVLVAHQSLPVGQVPAKALVGNSIDIKNHPKRLKSTYRAFFPVCREVLLWILIQFAIACLGSR